MQTAQQNIYGDPAYYLEHAELDLEEEDDLQYEEVTLDEDNFIAPNDEDLEAAVRAIREQEQDERMGGEKLAEAELTYKPEQTDDFVRNFLVRMNMLRSLDCFQNEWYEKQEKGELNINELVPVPDVYSQNQRLMSDSLMQREEATKFREAAVKAKELCIKMRKERDYHRLQHRRLVQEKNKLIGDIKKLRDHYESYEPLLRQMQTKYELAMKEKMLTKIDRDRAVGEATGLRTTLQHVESLRASIEGAAGPPARAGKKQWGTRDCKLNGSSTTSQAFGPTQQSLLRNREKAMTVDKDDTVNKNNSSSNNKDSVFPPDKGVNPFLAQLKQAKQNVRASSMRQTNLFTELHKMPISGLAIHPRKPVAVSVSDDYTWKLWTIPSGEHLMTGEGHEDWLTSADFSPDGRKLATASGDQTVRVWSFESGTCEQIFKEHLAPVWSVNYHWTGNFLLTASSDSTAKIFDLNSLRSRFTLRGHQDAVNSAQFLPYSNTVLTASADKTISLWDARNSVCAHTFYGHMHSVNSASFNQQGTLIASCDSFGSVKVWDVRRQAVMLNVATGPHSANQLAFDPTGNVVVAASNDGTVKIIEIATEKLGSLSGHQDAVQCVSFDRLGQNLISGGSDCTIRMWS